jgi:hypothetical protein
MKGSSIARGFIAAAVLVPCLILLLPVLAAATALLLFVSTVRGLASLLERRFIQWPELLAFDRELGWKPRPNLDVHYLADGDDVFRVVTDREGWPGSRSIEESPLVVIGDSFAFGYGVDPERSFASQDRRMGIKAIGAPGYSMVQGVVLMEHFGPRLAGKLVVWMAYLENDLQDNLAPEMRRYRAPFVRPSASAPDGWEIVDEHVGPHAWQCSNLDRRRLFPSFCVPGPMADRAYSAADYLIGRAAAACRRAGAQLAIVTVPTPMQLTKDGMIRMGEFSGRPGECDVSLPDRHIAESCRRHGVPMVAGKDRLTWQDYKRREGIHWNERGHRRVAVVLRELFDSFASGTLVSGVPGRGRALETRYLGEIGER